MPYRSLRRYFVRLISRNANLLHVACSLTCFLLLPTSTFPALFAQPPSPPSQKEIGEAQDAKDGSQDSQGTPPATSPFAVPPGFEVIEVAPDKMAHDAFCMTLDAAGRPVLSGPGYIRTLVDDNQDGIYDRYVQWTASPKEGAQGLWSEGLDLYWVGDKGLWRSRDANRDLVADGPPTKVLSLPTGGEHDSHAIRRGPDGYWYLMVGNLAKGITSLSNDPNSMVPRPRAGTLWRISPDFKTRSVWSHGLRNAYDFDFLPSGEVVTFDSDGERDITLPSYRPTRIMLLAPGSDAGWVSEGWKDSDSRLTMPMVLAELGRGSPTGVAVYRHYAFPEKYRNAVFALDWTFGRILCIYPEYVASQADSDRRDLLRLGAETFLETQGTVGFAPTDVCIAPDGGLLVCVGGRGTRGAVYRIVYRGERAMTAPSLWSDQKATETNRLSETQEKQLQKIAFAPCPNEAWSEANWRTVANELEWSNLANAVLDRYTSQDGRKLNEEARLGVLQILLRSGAPLATSIVKPLLQSENEDIQSLSWRAIGLNRVPFQPKELAELQQEINKQAPTTTGSPWSRLLGDATWRARGECIGFLRWPLFLEFDAAAKAELRYSPFKHIQLWSAARASTAKPTTRGRELELALYGRLLYGVAPTRLDTAVIDALAKRISENRLAETTIEQLEAITLLQAALGDPRHTVPQQENAPNSTIFDGYVGRFTDQLPAKARESWTAWLVATVKKARLQGMTEVQSEALRGLAMLKPSSPSAIECCLECIDAESHPTFDIHALCCLACCSGRRDAIATQATTTALLALHDKVRIRALNIDNHWQSSLTQMVTKLFQNDGALAKSLVTAPEFGSNEDLLFAESLPKPFQREAQSKILASLTERPAKEWSVALLKFAIGSDLSPSALALLRNAGSEPSLRSFAIEMLAKKPQAEDYSLFLDALASSDRSSWKPAWEGMRALPMIDPKREAIQLTVHAVRSAGSGGATEAILYSRLRNAATKLQWSGAPTVNAFKPWCELLQRNVDATEFASIDSVLQPAGKWLTLVEASGQQTGDVSRGKLLFAQAKCSQCHGGGTALGPDLAGTTKRFSREDLFRAIFEPSNDVSDRYRALKVLTTEGEVITGMNVYHSADGVTLQTADGTLVRINQDDIEKREEVTESIMPTGLLDGWNQQQIADLYAYIKSL